jgi:hypothetical protein
MQAAVSIFGKMLFIMGAVLFVVAFYQQSMFFREWREDQAATSNWAERGLLSIFALCYLPLSERCQGRRRKVVLSLLGAFISVPLGIFLERLVE